MSVRTLSGLKRGRLSIGKRIGTTTVPSGQTFALYTCTCDCGNVVEKDSRYFGKQKVPSCGCYIEENRTRCYPIFDEIDNDLKELVWRTHPAGYAIRSGGNIKRYAHRVVLERILKRKMIDGEVTDHINRNKLDNRRSNLRVADMSLNTVNRDLRSDNTLGYVGVHRYQPKEYKLNGWKPSYTFRIWRKGHKVFYSKCYKTAKEAHLARLKKLEEYIY